jgi:hypothetical protein
MWVSKIATCLLVPLWATASVVAANAFVPVSASNRRSTSSSNGNSNTVIEPLSNSRHPYRIPANVPSRTTPLAAEDVPRGGGLSVETDQPPSLPTLADYRKFAIPCLGLWVAQPLLSLVDTAFVGLSAAVPAESAAQLAALGPATTFFDGATYLFAFLNVATTNLYSTALAQKGEQSDQAEAVVCTASRVAMRCGIGIMLFLMAFARPLLSLYIGRFCFLICAICYFFAGLSRKPFQSFLTIRILLFANIQNNDCCRGYTKATALIPD